MEGGGPQETHGGAQPGDRGREGLLGLRPRVAEELRLGDGPSGHPSQLT